VKEKIYCYISQIVLALLAAPHKKCPFARKRFHANLFFPKGMEQDGCLGPTTA
jgi:hypothetical protein